MSAHLTVFISGGGSNLKAIIDACQQGTIDAQIVAVFADRVCAGQQHAIDVAIPFYLVDRKLPPADFADALLHLIPKETDLIVLAGFLSIVPPSLIAHYPQRIINLHPSLLPKFGGAGMYGLHVHEAVLAAGEQESGCTVHYVDDGIDTGHIIAQRRVAVMPNDSARDLQKRIQKEEHRLLVETIAQWCSNLH